MFDLRANSRNDRKNKAKINYENWEDIVKYPEHKNKSKGLLYEDDLKKNVQLVDRTDDFKEDVKKITRDQKWHNKNRTKNFKRDYKNEKEMEDWLLDKQVATNYTVQENSIFFQKKFNGDRNKIIDFYKKSMDSILESTGIDKKRVIYATIHFDQSNPHLHFSISNVHSAFNKEHKKILYAVNSKKYNPVNILKDQQNARKAWVFHNKLTEEEKKNFKTNEFQNIFKTKYAEKLNFHKPIVKVLNEKYDSKIYANAKDHISMERIRGYKRNVTNEKLHTLEWHNLKERLVFKFRETKLKKELESSEKKYKDDRNMLLGRKLKYSFQMNSLKQKYNETIDNPSKSLNPNIPEQNMLNKKKYFLRKDIDLYILLGKTGFDKQNITNEIQKNRIYNTLLHLCHEAGKTPQQLASDLYNGSYAPKKYKNKKLIAMQETILKHQKFPLNEPIQKNKKLHFIVKNQMSNNIDLYIDKLKMFTNLNEVSKITIAKEEALTKNIGISSNLVKKLKIHNELKQSPILKKKYVDHVLDKKRFKEHINKNTKNFTYSKKSSIMKVVKTLEKIAEFEQEQLAKMWKQVECERVKDGLSI